MAAAPTINCKVCESGVLKKQKVYRLSGPAVVIGYIFLIPCVLSMMFWGAVIVASGGSVGEVTEQNKKEARVKLENAGIDPSIIEATLNYKDLTPEQESMLSEDDKDKIREVRLTFSAGNAGAGLGALMAGGFSFIALIMSFCGGLLGWLLTMKKKVLKCVTCEAVVGAS